MPDGADAYPAYTLDGSFNCRMAALCALSGLLSVGPVSVSATGHLNHINACR
ncbi:hypothetical protein HMPREF0208_00901 [Citrobacter koseri]|nr:hypothetical protein HMPREF3207_01093 [Citrobacter koseri]KXB45929.1 hypothetical protein HMPREF0208_00901 [Citrobacter koseri]